MHRAAASVVVGIAAMAIAVAAASCGNENSSASGGSGGIASGGGGTVGALSACTSAESCLVGQACCGSLNAGGPPLCQAAPCPSTLQQVCLKSVECLEPGFVCGEDAGPFGIRFCEPQDGRDDGPGPSAEASDAPFQSDAAVRDDASNEASATGDASASEGGSPGDAAPGNDGATDGDAGESGPVDASAGG